MLLALDTSTATTVLALAEEGALLAALTVRAPGRAEETLLPNLERLLAAAGRERAAIDTVAVGLGPGSFTSLRVGIASAKGLALGLRTKLVGVGTLRAIARGIGSEHASAAVFTDARRGEVYAAAYAVSARGSLELVPPMHGDAEALARQIALQVAGAPLVVAGDGFQAYGETLLRHLGPAAARMPAVYDVPRPEALVLEAYDAIARGELAALDQLEPHYVRPSDAKRSATPLRTSLGPDFS